MVEELSDAIFDRLQQARQRLTELDILGASADLQVAALQLGRRGDPHRQAQLLRLAALMCELLEERAAAGVHYCCAMRIASSHGDEALADLISQRLAYLARPSSEVPFVAAGAGQEAVDSVIRQMAKALDGRLELIQHGGREGLVRIVDALCDGQPNTASRRWWLDDLQYLAGAASDGQVREAIQDVKDPDLLKEFRSRGML